MGVVGKVHGRAVLTRRVRVLGEEIAALLPPNARVLDIGSGDGSVAATVQRARDDVQMTGIDVLVRPDTEISIAPFDGSHVPYDDGSFDAVTLVDVLHHTHDPSELLAEAARVAPTAVIVKDHLAEGLLARPTLRAMDWVGNAHYGVALPYNYWSERQWHDAFTRLDISVDREITRLGLYPRPASWLFERRLHVLWRLVAAAGAHDRST
jgi:SAM-dependent methyltransferase